MGAKVSSGGGKGHKPNSEPNVIPFIDIMLVLLIIFMVSAPLPTVDLKVDLPPPNVPPPETPRTPPMNVTIYDVGGSGVKVYVDEVETPVDELGKKVTELMLTRHGDSQNIFEEPILMRSDLSVKYRDVMEVMNKIQEEGFLKVVIISQDARK